MWVGDLVVEIAVVFCGRELLRDHGEEHFLDRGLAAVPVIAMSLTPHVSRQQAASCPRARVVSRTMTVGMEIPSNGREATMPAAPFLLGLEREFVSVEVFSVDTEEEVARFHGATVRLHRVDGDLLVAFFGQAAQAALYVGQGEVHANSSTASRAASTSEKWMVWPPMIW